MTQLFSKKMFSLVLTGVLTALVACGGDDGGGEEEKIPTLSTPANLEIVAATTTKSNITIKWDNVSQATGYVIERKVVDGTVNSFEMKGESSICREGKNRLNMPRLL